MLRVWISKCAMFYCKCNIINITYIFEVHSIICIPCKDMRFWHGFLLLYKLVCWLVVMKYARLYGHWSYDLRARLWDQDRTLSHFRNIPFKTQLLTILHTLQLHSCLSLMIRSKTFINSGFSNKQSILHQLSHFFRTLWCTVFVKQ